MALPSPSSGVNKMRGLFTKFMYGQYSRFYSKTQNSSVVSLLKYQLDVFSSFLLHYYFLLLNIEEIIFLYSRQYVLYGHPHHLPLLVFKTQPQGSYLCLPLLEELRVPLFFISWPNPKKEVLYFHSSLQHHL